MADAQEPRGARRAAARGSDEALRDPIRPRSPIGAGRPSHRHVPPPNPPPLSAQVAAWAATIIIVRNGIGAANHKIIAP